MFAEDAFAHYMALMGQGVGPLMTWVVDDDCACNQEMIDEEAASLGLPLMMTVSSGDGAAQVITVDPVGPAVMRSQAFVVDLPPAAGDRVTLRLEATPLFWEIDHVELAPASAEEVTARTLLPTEASFVSGDVRTDVTATLSESDHKRVVLQTRDRVDVRFDAPDPPPAALERTAIASLRGYYEMPIGGAPGINAATVIAHRTGLMSLPRFAAGLPRP